MTLLSLACAALQHCNNAAAASAQAILSGLVELQTPPTALSAIPEHYAYLLKSLMATAFYLR